MDKFNQILDAIEELKELLIAGTNVEVALMQVAADYDLTLTPLRNRATTALGDLETYGERARNVRQTLNNQLAEREARIADENEKIRLANRKFLADIADFVAEHPQHAGLIGKVLRGL